MSEILDGGTIVLDTPEHIQMASLLALRNALSLEVSTGLTARRSMLRIAQQCGLTVKRTKHGAWQDVDLYIRTAGGPAGRPPVLRTTGKPVRALPLPRTTKETA